MNVFLIGIRGGTNPDITSQSKSPHWSWLCDAQLTAGLVRLDWPQLMEWATSYTESSSQHSHRDGITLAILILASDRDCWRSAELEEDSGEVSVHPGSVQWQFSVQFSVTFSSEL